MSEQIDALVRRYRRIGSDIAELCAEQVQIKAQVDAMVQVGWKHCVDGVGVHKREANRRFSAEHAVGLLDAQTRETCVITRYDPVRLRAAVEDLGLLEDCMLLDPQAAAVVKL